MRKLLAALMILAGPVAFAQVDATEVGPKLKKEAEEAKQKTGMGKKDTKKWEQAFNTENSFTLEGKVKSVKDNELVIERENLPDVELSVRDQTKVEQDGEQKNVKALREGDQVRAQFQVVDDEPVAVQISAQSSSSMQQPSTGMGGGSDAGTQ